MDIGARRLLWKKIWKLRDEGRSVILTSHSMEECENLCTKIAVSPGGAKCTYDTRHALKWNFIKTLLKLLDYGERRVQMSRKCPTSEEQILQRLHIKNKAQKESFNVSKHRSGQRLPEHQTIHRKTIHWINFTVIFIRNFLVLDSKTIDLQWRTLRHANVPLTPNHLKMERIIWIDGARQRQIRHRGLFLGTNESRTNIFIFRQKSKRDRQRITRVIQVNNKTLVEF